MIQRIWHGYTTKQNAPDYQKLLREEVLPSIEEKELAGYLGIDVLMRHHDNEVEFITVMTFDSLQCVIEFQGPDYENCYVPEAAQRVLSRWDRKSQHYDLIDSRVYPPSD